MTYLCSILMRCVYTPVQAGHSKVVTEWENEKKSVSRLEEEVKGLKEELKHMTVTANDREVCGRLSTVPDSVQYVGVQNVCGILEYVVVNVFIYYLYFYFHIILYKITTL